MGYQVKHLRFPKGAIEKVAGLRQVAGQGLVADPTVNTPNIALQICDEGVDSGQELRRLFFRTGET